MARVNLAIAYHRVGRWEDALEVRDVAVDLRPGVGRGGHGMVLLQMNRLDEAREAFEESEGWIRDLGLAVIAHRLGRPNEAERSLARFQADRGGQPAWIALGYAMLEDREQTFEWLEELTAETASVSPALLPLATRPEFSWLEGDPRWYAFRERVGQSPDRLASIAFEPSPPGTQD